MVYSVDVAKKLAGKFNNSCDWDKLKVNFLHNGITNEASTEFIPIYQIIWRMMRMGFCN